MYVRGEAYLRLRNGAKAVTEYKKILDHQGIASTSPLYPWRGWDWGAPMLCKETLRKPRRPIRTSSQPGKTPTPMSLS